MLIFSIKADRVIKIDEYQTSISITIYFDAKSIKRQYYEKALLFFYINIVKRFIQIIVF